MRLYGHESSLYNQGMTLQTVQHPWILRFRRGDTFEFQTCALKVRVDPILGGSDIVDLTNCKQIALAVKENVNDCDPPVLCVSKTTGNITVIGDPKSGIIRVRLSPDDTIKFPNKPFVYVFEVKVRDQNDDVWTVLRGNMNVRAGVKEAGI